MQAKDYEDIGYDLALSIVKRQMDFSTHFDPNKTYKIDCMTLFDDTPSSLANRLGITDVQMFYYLNGKSTPQMNMLRHISTVTGISTATLYMVFKCQKHEYNRAKKRVNAPSIIPDYMKPFFKEWEIRQPPRVTEKSKARDERRRSTKIKEEPEGPKEDKWLLRARLKTQRA
jgi:hypothetical protein